MNLLLEITLSDWTPTIPTATYHFVKIFETGGRIVLSLRKYLPNAKHMIQMPDKNMCSRAFTSLELGLLKMNLGMMLKATRSFVTCFAPLGYEYELEKYILGFEKYVIGFEKEILENENKPFIAKLQEEKDVLQNENKNLQDEIEFLQDEIKQMERNYKKYKYEFNELALDYHRLYDSSLWPKQIELIKRNKELEDLFQKEKFEKEQFVAYCSNLNEKLMELM
jgi:hypothetical protein